MLKFFMCFISALSPPSHTDTPASVETLRLALFKAQFGEPFSVRLRVQFEER